MTEIETATERCGYDVHRTAADEPGNRVRITTGHGDLYLEVAVYDTMTDEEFIGFVAAWLADDVRTVEEHIETVRERHPGLASLKQASDRHERDRAIGRAVRALTPVAGAYDLPGFLGTGRVDYGDAIIALAEQLGDYVKNGASA